MSTRDRRRPSEQGFSLLVLSVWLLVLGIAVATFAALLPNRTDELRVDRTRRILHDARDEVLAFVVETGRLPAPDATIPGDGFENPGADAGALPFRSMALPQAALDTASLPLRYAPYRNGAGEADLAAPTSLYAPGPTAPYPQRLPAPADYGCSDSIPASPINLLDFCVALEHAEAATVSADFANTGPVTVNAAYVLVSGGLEDANGDGVGTSLDGANDDVDVSFEDPARGRDSAYDDFVLPVTFGALRRELACDPLVGSLNLLVATADDAKNLANVIDVQKFQADVAAELETYNTILNFIVVTNAGFAAAGGVTTAGIECAAAVAAFGLCITCNIACAVAVATAATLAATVIVEVVNLGIQLDRLGTAIALQIETGQLLDAANQHVCDVIADVVAADARGGLR